MSKGWGENAAAHAAVIALACLFFLPFLWMLGTAVKPDNDIFLYPPRWLPSVWQWTNFSIAWRKAPFARFYFNSVVVTAAITLIQLTTAAMAAYAFARLEFPGKSVLFVSYLLVMMIPSQVTLIPNFITLKTLGMLNTYWALILPFVATGFGTFLIRQYFLSIPQELFDAAVVDGAGHLRILWTICVPIAAPAFATFGLLTTMWHWNDFFWPLIVVQSNHIATPPLGVVFFVNAEAGTNYGLLMAAATVVNAPLVVAFLLAQRWFIDGVTMSAVK
jgi:ABC-type glycerol-3-phosphate transport system permease component